MYNHRLIILFALFVAGFCALGFRLAHLQVSRSDYWRAQMRSYVHHQTKIETSRGSIVDRNGVVLAFDDACYDLAIDYRAINLDDRWISTLAHNRLKDAAFTSQKDRQDRIAAMKAQIAAQIEAIPANIAKNCDTSALTDPSPDSPPLEKVLARFEEIKQIVINLRQNLWSRSYDADDDKQDSSALDDAAYNKPLKEEHIVHTIIPHISDATAFYFRQHADEYPGVAIVDSHTRVYPMHTIGSHIVGTMRSVTQDVMQKDSFMLPNLLTDDDKGNLAGYLPGDKMGETGIEKLMENQLRGTRGVQLVEDITADPTAATTAPSENPDKRVDPEIGKNVKLTIDIALQKDIEDTILDPSRDFLKGDDEKDHCIALVVLSLDGQVLAMISNPTYDPNTIDITRIDLNKAVNRPLANRTLEAYRPGSTVKPLVAAAALTEKVITPETSFTCIGYLIPGRREIFKCAEIHGTLDLRQAIAESCNVYFYNVGDRMGVSRLATWFHRYGFGQETDFELPDSNGVVVDPTKSSDDPQTQLGESRFLGIGEGPIDASPLQLANGFATLLRGGTWIAPRIVAGTPVKSSRNFSLSPQVLATVKEAMHAVTISGTAKETFRGFNMAIGGKTGTADVTNRPVIDESGNLVLDTSHPVTNRDGTPMLGPDRQPIYRPQYVHGVHSWFVGYAPQDNPKFVIVAFKEFGGYGGKFAAPLVKESILQLQRHHYLKATDVP